MSKIFISALSTILIFSACQNSNIETNSQGTPYFPELKTNTEKHSIALDQVVSGGIGKDVIPAINQPKFINLEEADLQENAEGIFIEGENENKYYPFSILVWHEIVNDFIDEKPIAVTFCPLCGSSIVYERTINNQTVNFGVSGLLYQSNLLMYDNLNESLWSQSIGEAVIGDFTGEKLNIHETQILTFTEIKKNYQNVKVLSKNTGFEKDYNIYPYGNYEESERLMFKVNNEDLRFPTKEIFYIVPYKDSSIAIRQTQLEKGQLYEQELENITISAEKKENGTILIKVNNEKTVGYFEMWFSWATHHQKNGLIFEPSETL